jgi:hypothetical protein
MAEVSGFGHAGLFRYTAQMFQLPNGFYGIP